LNILAVYGQNSYDAGRAGVYPQVPDYYVDQPGRLDKRNLTCDCSMCAKEINEPERRWRWDRDLLADWADFSTPLWRQFHRGAGRYRA
jgi:hypothetical protein